MRVIIIGAGVGGTSAGIALQRLGHDVTIYDRIHENKPVGAALSLWSNGVKVLNWLGLADEVARLGGLMDRMAYYDGHTGETMTQFSLSPVTEKTGQRPYPVARADLQQLLIDTFGMDRIHLGRKMVRIDQDSSGATVTFDDGETATADIVIGADGAKSITRDYVLGERRERTYRGYVNYNGLVPVNEAFGPADQWTTYVADGKRVSAMPVAGNRFYFFVDVPGPSGEDYDRADGIAPLEKAFAGWAPGVQSLLASIDPEQSLNRVEIWDLDPIDTWVRGRVAILGDAAHNTAPDVGQGACSALEDSFVLGLLFATTTVSPEDTLLRYERARAERAGDLVERGRRRSHETHAFEPEVTQAWYAGLRTETGENIIRGIVGNIIESPTGMGSDLP
ncbi:FAD-dependent urate hydroxylase HpxO [Microbacterium amylolyticum]|uniref:FAD-dependent urate hydroxylase n=1 Tax=Microbacterium amylolyticum TaxID=936337 RepID=A0ABS4ZGS3_9MICO|nr:FAD-dependent urate hydroxylase HpxO [Microbacterium amylolyticum]MBP2436474.1 FAD-dependent urate hydroxylase [Microbacterium amylolyticum]